MKKFDIVFLILAVILAIFLNAHYISGLYYEQDLGEYVYDVLRILSGKKWYYIQVSNKPPGIHLIYILAFKLFGNSFISIQIFSLFANILAVILLWFLARYILFQEVRFYFLLPLFYALFSVSESLQGHTSNCETFLNPFQICGILFLGLAQKSKRNLFYFLSGLILTFGFLIKQSCLAIFMAGAVFIFMIKIINKESLYIFLKKLSLYFIGPIVILLLVLVYFFYLGTLNNFIQCVFIRNIEYIKNVLILKKVYTVWTLRKIWEGLKIEIIMFIFLATLGISFSFIRYKKYERLLLLLWFFIPFFMVIWPGLHYRHHYLEIVASVLALGIAGLSDLYGFLISKLKQKRLFLRFFVSIGVLILSYPFFHTIMPLVKKNKLADSFFITQRYIKAKDKEKYLPLLIKEAPDAARRFIIANYVKEHTDKKDKIFVWDGFATGAIYLWTERKGIVDIKTKYSLLPDELGYPFRSIFSKKNYDYIKRQKIILEKILEKPPIYIIVVEATFPIPNAPFNPKEMLLLEKKAFKEFFIFLNQNYILEKEFMGCFAYRFKNY